VEARSPSLRSVLGITRFHAEAPFIVYEDERLTFESIATRLCQLTADACGLPVVAGPVEATAIGNALAQAPAHGVTTHPRELVRRTQELTVCRPSGDDAAWECAARWIGLS
jgi:hypothetical protein